MQSAGQYGVNEVPQFVVGGSQHPSPHIFSLVHDMSLSGPTSSGHAHPGHHQQHLCSHLNQVQQQQQQQSKEAQHLNLHHHPHQQQTSHSPHQQRQQHQHVQQQHHQHMQQQQQQQVAQQQQQQQQVQQTLQHQHHQQQSSVQHQQHMVHELGLGGPESPEAAAAPSSVVSRPSPSMYTKQMSAVLARDLALGHETLGHDDDGIEGEEGRSTGGNRWPRQETLLLIKIRSEMDSNFRDSGLKGPLWEDVARKLSELGYNRSAKKCKEKFENIHKYYKKTKDGKAGRQDGKNYRFFSELDALYAGRNTSTQADAAAALILPGLAHGLMPSNAVSPPAFRAAEDASGFAASDSSEENHDEPEPDLDDGNSSKKRKRKESETAAGTSSSKVMFLESLVKQLMDKQEIMQRKFLESMERREQERIARVEAWKTQEMERLTSEHQLRTQEHNLAVTRDAALVAVLHKLTGETLQLPQLPAPPPPTPSLQPNTTAIQLHNQNPQQQQQQQLLEDEPDKLDVSFDPHSKRWPTPEVHALIRLRIDMESRFQETGPKGPLWEDISSAMSSMGYNRNTKRCKEKWENVNKYYRKAKESNKKRAENSKTCPYFHQLETLYRNGGLGSSARKAIKVDEALEEEVPTDLQQEHDLRDDQSAKLVQGDAVNKELPAAAAAAAVVDAGGAGPAAAGGGSATNGTAARHFSSSPENGSSCGNRGGGGGIAKMVNF